MTIDLTIIVNSFLCVALGVVMIFLFQFILNKIFRKKSPKKPSTIPGFSGIDKDGTPIIWCRHKPDLDEYKNGAKGKIIDKIVQADYNYYR